MIRGDGITVKKLGIYVIENKEEMRTSMWEQNLYIKTSPKSLYSERQ